MSAWLEGLKAGLGLSSSLELLAVLLGLAYVVLAIGQKRSCWIAGGASTALYIIVFLDAKLYLQSVLQVAYVVLAAYGWWAWRPAGGGGSGNGKVIRWSLGHQLGIFAGVIALVAITAPLMLNFTDTASPWLDSLWTWASVAATWMMARRVLENWLWWIVIDIGLTLMFISQGLGPTAILYLVYAALAGMGWLTWRREMEATTVG